MPRTAPTVPPLTGETPPTHRHRWWTLGVLCLSLLMIVVDNTIVNVALPTIQRDLASTTSQLQWIVDAYVLVFAGLLLTAGSLGDRYGRKGALGIGLVLIAAASVASSLADSSAQLIAGRVLMGVGAALIMPATLSILTNVFSDPRDRAKAIGIWAGTSGLGVALGPVTGGWLLEHFWWGSVFLVNVPVAAVALIAGWRLVPTSQDPSARRTDVGGAALSIAGVMSLVWAIIKAGERSWTEGSVVAGFVAAAVLLVGFVLWELRVPHPLLDVRLFHNRRFSMGSTAIALTFFALFGPFFLLTQYLQFVQGDSPLEAGVRLVPIAVTVLVFAPVFAKLAVVIGTKLVVGTGLAATSLGLALMAWLTADSDDALLAGCLVVIGVGVAATTAPATESVMSAVPQAKAGVGSAVNDTSRQLGGALGVAVVGSIASARYASRLGSHLAGDGAEVPDAVVDAAEQSVGAAVQAGARMGGIRGPALIDAAHSAFMDGWSTSLLTASAAAFVGAMAAFVLLPSRSGAAAAEDGENGEPGR